MQGIKKKTDFTNGKVFIALFWFVLPIIATNLLQMAYNAADMMVVSLSSEENAVGAIGTTSSFIHLIVNLFIGFSVGANVVVARNIGAKNTKKTQDAVHTSLVMSVIFGFLGAGLGIAVSKPVLTLMGNTGSLLALACRYTYIYFAGVPFLAVTNYLIAIFRAKGDSKTPLIVLSIAGLFNVGLNFFFVVVVGLSVEGVALATALSNVLSAIVLLIKLSKDKDETNFSFKKLKMDARAFKDMLLIGLPAGIQGALFSLSNMLIQSSVVSVNNKLCPPGATYQPVVNGNAAGANIEGFVYTAMNAVSQGAITFTGQNIGAEKPERIHKVAYSCFALVSLTWFVMTAIIVALYPSLLSFYGVVKGEEGSLQRIAYETAIVRMKYITLPYVLCGVMEVCSGVLRGLGKSIISTVISLIGACVFRVIWILTVFSAVGSLESIFISYPISWILTASVIYVVARILLHKLIQEKRAREKIE